MDAPTSITKPLNDASLLKTQAYINGSWVNASDDSTFSVDNPATSKMVAQVANLNTADCQRAITAANRRLSR